MGTPIGNLEDITFRAVRILKQVDVIAAEDTRHTGKLLHHFQIDTPQISYHEHNRQRRLQEIITRLQQQQAIALVTDAGMPGISDPGYELVQACRTERLPVVPIPGPTAVITALCGSGLASDQFIFEGFLPVKGSLRQHRLALLQTECRTMVLYEAPHRLQKTLADLAQILGFERKLTVARELTKRYEEFWHGSIEAAQDHFHHQPPKGEFTLVIAGANDHPTIPSESLIRHELSSLLQSGLSRSVASRQLAINLGCSKNLIYQIALTLHVSDLKAEE